MDNMNSDSTTIAIPVKERELGEFISGLLGQPQSLEREQFGYFDINHQWLINLHHIINQRISQQHNSTLLEFSGEIFYRGGLSRKFTSFQSFEAYAEPQQIISYGVKLRMTYLVYFPDKKTPEKQEMTFYASEDRPVSQDPLRMISRRSQSGGFLSYRIDATERTWAEDIEKIIKEHVSSVFSKPQGIAVYKELILVMSAFVAVIGGILLPLLMDYFIKNNLAQKALDKIKSINDSETITLQTLSEKIDNIFYIQESVISLSSTSPVYVAMSVAGGFALSFFFIYLAEIREPRFVALTDASLKRREIVIKKYNRRRWMSAIAYLLSIAASVAGNYIYYYLSVSV